MQQPRRPTEPGIHHRRDPLVSPHHHRRVPLASSCEAAGDSQITVLGVKHVLLTIVFVWGLVWYLRARKFPGVSGSA